jgi:hypothetical protein
LGKAGTLNKTEEPHGAFSDGRHYITYGQIPPPALDLARRMVQAQGEMQDPIGKSKWCWNFLRLATFLHSHFLPRSGIISCDSLSGFSDRFTATYESQKTSPAIRGLVQ